MVSILDEDCSVNWVATQVAWYSPCVIWSKVGASGRSDDGILEWVVGWVCGRGFFRSEFRKVVYLGYCDGILLER